jgi:hypothetical protein
MESTKFIPKIGTGTITLKPSADGASFTGLINLPEYGRCFIDGTKNKDDKVLTLAIKQDAPTDVGVSKPVIGSITMPSTHDTVRKGVIKTGSRTWRATIVQRTSRYNEGKPYLSVMLPDVAAPLF